MAEETPEDTYDDEYLGLVFSAEEDAVLMEELLAVCATEERASMAILLRGS